MELFSHLHIQTWVILTIAMMLTAFVLPGLKVSGPVGAFLAVAGLALVNTHIWSAALFFAVPDSLTAHTATLIVANGLIFWILVKLLPGIEVTGIISAFLAPILFTIFSIFLNYSIKFLFYV